MRDPKADKPLLSVLVWLILVASAIPAAYGADDAPAATPERRGT
ncbi:MAG TPA: hypothetical protein VGC34_11055 [Steroidobacteraceae bacterium]